MDGDNDAEEYQQQTQLKQLSLARVYLLFPLTQVLARGSGAPPPNFRCWRRMVRSDHWVGLEPVALHSVQLEPFSQLPHSGAAGHTPNVVPSRAAAENPVEKIGPSSENASPSNVPHTRALEPLTFSGTSSYIPLSHDTGDLSGTLLNDRLGSTCALDELFCEGESITLNTFRTGDARAWRTNVRCAWRQ